MELLLLLATTTKRAIIGKKCAKMEMSRMEQKGPTEPALERADSECECELMIEALRRELGTVRVSGLTIICSDPVSS